MNKKQKFDENWLEKEQAKDKVFVDNYKQQVINSIKGLKKEDIIVIKKYTLWQRIKKSLGF
jgi:hypothetical protein